MSTLRLVVPKGRIYTRVVQLLQEAGIRLQGDERAYRPLTNDPEIEIKIMKPQNIPQLLELGSHDAGFTGHDWVAETGAAVTELLDLQFDPVQIVAAVPQAAGAESLRGKKITVATEYEALASAYLREAGYDFRILRTFGATEVFPPDDADMIIDNTSTGRTLAEHDLQVIATLLRSSTRFVANQASLENPWKREKIDRLTMLFRSILDARERVMLEMNVAAENLEAVIRILPCMRAPTVSPLYHEKGYAVKTAVKKDEAVQLIPRLKALGATDILEYDFRKVVI